LDEVSTALNAGSDSTGAALAWTCHRLAAHPDVQERVAAEVAREVGLRAPTAADAERLTFTHQVIQEVLRLHPPIWGLFVRQASEDTVLAGHRVRAGTWIFVFPYVLHRDARVFPDPERFDPGRFERDR